MDRVYQTRLSGSKWTELDWNGPDKLNGLKRPKWTEQIEWTKVEQNRPNGLKWTELDLNGKKCYIDVAQHKCNNNKYFQFFKYYINNTNFVYT